MNVIGDVRRQALHPDRRHRRFRRHAGQRRQRAAGEGRHRGDGLHHPRRALGRRGRQDHALATSRRSSSPTSIQPTEAVKAAGNIRVLSIAPLIGEAIARTAARKASRACSIEAPLVRASDAHWKQLLIGVVGGPLFPRRLQRLGAAMTSIKPLTCTGNPHSPRRARGWAGPTNGAPHPAIALSPWCSYNPRHLMQSSHGQTCPAPLEAGRGRMGLSTPFFRWRNKAMSSAVCRAQSPRRAHVPARGPHAQPVVKEKYLP